VLGATPRDAEAAAVASPMHVRYEDPDLLRTDRFGVEMDVGVLE
jgi:hypothetical protein